MPTKEENGEILSKIHAVGKSLSETKDGYRKGVAVIRVLNLLMAEETDALLHICPDCRKKTMEKCNVELSKLGFT